MVTKQPYSNDVIEKIVSEYRDGASPAQLRAAYGIPRSTLYYWLSRATVSGSMQKDRVKALREENTRLKLILAEGVLEMIMEQANLSTDKDWRQKLQELLSLDERVLHEEPLSKPNIKTKPANR